MMQYLEIGTSMLFFKRKPQEEPELPHQDAIDAARKQTHKVIHEAAVSMDELNRLLEAKGDTAYNIFRATPAGSTGKKQ
jgi:Cdc6-like AAA superfamily ATPase